MSRRSSKGSKTRRRSRGGEQEEEELPRDQVDEFMENRLQVPLGPAAGDRRKKKAANVFVDLESSSSEEGDNGEKQEDDNDVEEEDMEATLRQNALLLSDDEDEDEDEGNEEGKEPQEQWGKNKFVFYQEREEDSSSSEERLHEEEAARIRSKKLAQMKESDFLDLPEDEAKEESKKSKKKQKKQHKKAQEAPEAAEEEVVVAGTGGDGEGKDKELAAIVAELRAKTAELREVVQPILQKAAAGEIETSSGVSYMELKNLLLLNYCLNLNFYILLKAEGHSVKDHPVIDELVRLRLLIEKTRPIDEKLRPQINRLLKMASLGAESVMSDPSMLRANPAQMLLAGGGEKKASKGPAEEQEEEKEKERVAGEDEVYRAPRATSMFFDKDESKAAKRERREQRLKERAAKSSVMKMVQEEFAEGPEEQGTGLGVMDVDEEQREAQREQAEFEEDNFMRLRPTRVQKKAGKRDFVDELKSLDDFGDVERALKSARFQGGAGAGAAEGPLSKMAKKLQETQDRELVVEQQQQQQRDSRLVSKRDLEAEQAYDALLEENKKKRDEQRKKKYDANPNARRKVVEVPVADEAGGKRHISQQMEVNKGLSVRRKKDISRVKNKKKFANSEKKRAGMTRKIRKETSKYDGETAGINANVVRSTKL